MVKHPKKEEAKEGPKGPEHKIKKDKKSKETPESKSYVFKFFCVNIMASPQFERQNLDSFHKWNLLSIHTVSRKCVLCMDFIM